MTHVLSVTRFKSWLFKCYGRGWPTVLLKLLYVSTQSFHCLQLWTKAWNPSVKLSEGLKIIPQSWEPGFLSKPYSRSSMWSLPPPKYLSILTKRQNEGEQKSKWNERSSVFKGSFGSKPFSLSTEQAVSLGQLDLQHSAVWPHPPLSTFSSFPGKLSVVFQLVVMGTGMPPPGHSVHHALHQTVSLSWEESYVVATLPGTCVPKGEARASFFISTQGLEGFLAQLHTLAEIHTSSGPSSPPLAVSGGFSPTGPGEER